MSTTITLPSGTYTLVTIPTAPGISEIEFQMTDAVAVVPSPFTPSVMQTQAWPGADAWSLTLTLPKMPRSTAAPWMAFLAGLRGMQNVFQLGDPFGATAQGAADGAPVCHTSGSYNLTSATSLVTSGWTPGVYGQLLPGDYLQIGYRMHQVCEQVNSDNSGNATISIWPSLRESPSNGTAITLVNPVGLFRLALNQRTWHASYTGLVQLSFKATEVR